MARRKKRTAKRKGGRRRMGAAGSGTALVHGLVGLKAGELLGGLVMKFTAGKNINPYIIGAGQSLAGWYLAFKNRNPFVQGAGAGLLYMGASTIISQTGILKGIGQRPYRIPLKNGGSPKELPIINGRRATGQAGPNWQSVVAGVGMA